MSPRRELKRVMMIDDEPDFLAAARAWIEPRYELVARSDGLELEGELEAWDPAVLILDARLPGLDGFELCRRLRSGGPARALPVLLLTASHRDEDFVRALDAGADCYLTKPTTRRELLSRLDELSSVGR